MTEVKNEHEKEVPQDEESTDVTVENIDSLDLDNEVEIEENGKDSIVEELTAKLQEEESKRLRLLADYDNFKRRASLDKEAMQKYRAQSIVTNLIPVLDNFSRALSHEAQSEEATSMMTGMEMIYRNVVDALKSEGLVEIEALGKVFDPNFHQAIMTGTEEDKPSGAILEELQKGYMLKDRVLRPTMVKVNE
ncbi:nucleotide exchange factor GrpE [Filibacter tadaridae]|uniref:Protein GrpE n=1 Tax=Filibacter tadaridae TaxID=2483811 RepID=A0A3P5XTP0_9BACL|nr:nucleotide exchange factor GrpE [Filibacter tadaridae]VDC32482.1 heat shock protein GrpE [Filibacter tadaridae]